MICPPGMCPQETSPSWVMPELYQRLRGGSDGDESLVEEQAETDKDKEDMPAAVSQTSPWTESECVGPHREPPGSCSPLAT